MKKLIVCILLLSMLTAVVSGCSSTAGYFKGQWSFSKISSVEIAPDVDQSVIDMLMQEYGAEDKKGVEESALSKFAADGIFAPCYLKFDKKFSYTYDPVMEREATWVFYQTGENEGFISFYSELNAADGNPDPITNPTVVYNAETDTLFLTLHYISFMVTVELSR